MSLSSLIMSFNDVAHVGSSASQSPLPRSRVWFAQLLCPNIVDRSSDLTRARLQEIIYTMMHKLPLPSSSRSIDARIVKTDAALRRALLSLLERKPLEQITIREITAEAGVHYTTFFRHHATREALLDHVAADQINNLVELAVPIQDAFDTEAAFLALCQYVSEHRKLWTALLTGGAAGVMHAELLRASENLAPHRQRHVDWIPVELSVICSVTVIVETLAWWLKQPEGAVQAKDLARMLSHLTIATARSSPK